MSNVMSDSTVRDAFIESAARSIFVLAYADFVENSEDSDLPRARGGEDWMDVAPVNVPPNAYAMAGEMWARIEAANGRNMFMIFEQAGVNDADRVEDFAHYMVMMHAGTGVSWFDDHPTFDLKVPCIEISSFSFSEDAYYE